MDRLLSSRATNVFACARRPSGKQATRQAAEGAMLNSSEIGRSNENQASVFASPVRATKDLPNAEFAALPSWVRACLRPNWTKHRRKSPFSATRTFSRFSDRMRLNFGCQCATSPSLDSHCAARRATTSNTPALRTFNRWISRLRSFNAEHVPLSRQAI